MTRTKQDPSKSLLPPPSKREQEAIAEARSRIASRRPRVTTKFEADEDGGIAKIGAEHDDHAGWLARLQNLFGTNGSNFPLTQLNHVLGLVRDSHGKYDPVKANALLAGIEAASPADEVQAMLAVQMATTHELAMQVLRRAARVDQISQFDSAANMAVKLMRTYTMQVEALAKLQRGGEQVVKVVHVHSGAQAVVGNVVTAASGASGGRGGGADENRSQPHAKGELPAPSAQPMPPLRSEDAEREPVPLSSGER